MKFWKHTLITAFAFIGISTTVLYTSCEKDSCTELTCKNGGSCADGFCRCPTGYEGAECETKTADKFVGTYVGNTRCGNFPSIVDTVHVWIKTNPDVMAIVRTGNFSDTLIGKAKGNNIIVTDINNGNSGRYVNVVLDRKKLTLYTQYVTDAAHSQATVCNFIGLMP